MRREVNIALRSLSILALAGSKDFYRRLRLILFKKRQVFLFDKWRESRERKRRLARRARVASLSSQQGSSSNSSADIFDFGPGNKALLIVPLRCFDPLTQIQISWAVRPQALPNSLPILPNNYSGVVKRKANVRGFEDGTDWLS